jgi:hypothetical protein
VVVDQPRTAGADRKRIGLAFGLGIVLTLAAEFAALFCDEWWHDHQLRRQWRG